MDDKCIICGRIIPEGRQVCMACEKLANEGRTIRVPDLEKVTKGLKCCAVSMNDDDPFAKCIECPYNDESIFTDDCRAVLSKDALEVIMNAEIQRYRA